MGNSSSSAYFSLPKKTAFECAYHYLASARESSLANEKLLSSALLTEKINGAAERCLSAIPKGKAFRKNVTVTNSFGMKGKVGFDTLSALASERISVPDKYGSAHLFLGDLIRAAEKKELSITVSLDPLIPCRADAVLLNATGKLYFIGSGGEKNINMLRFLDAYTLREIRSDLRRAQELTLSSVSAALCSFENAAEHHFALEKIYGEAMDFAAKEEFTDNFIAEMFE